MNKRIRCLLFMFCLILLGINNTCYTEAATGTDIISPLYDVIITAKPTLTITDNQAKAVTTVSARKKCDISITMKLQKKSGSSWTTIKTWSSSKEDTAFLSLSQTYTVNTGSYRVYSAITAGGEEASVTSTVQQP